MDPVRLLPRAGSGPPLDPAAAAAAEAAAAAAVTNLNLSNYLYIVCGVVCGIIIIWKLTEVLVRYTRHIVCLNNDHQRYFMLPSPWLSWAKQHVLYAPVLRKRHNREIQLSSAINVGTLPSRFQMTFLIAYFATNVAFCVIDIPFQDSYEQVARLVRGRSGILATINMVPLFLLAGRNNPLVPLLGISFDTYNLLHRWFGRIVILEAITHTLAHYAKGGWAAASFNATFSVPYLLWGFIATLAFVAIGIQAWSPLRHAFYEIFKILHIALAVLSLVGLGCHIKLGGLDQMRYVYVTIGLWVADRVARVLRVAWLNWGRGTRTVIEALPGNAIRVTMTLARPWTPRPGQHAYLYMPTISFWQSHPFSVAWYDSTDDLGSDKLASNRQERSSMQKMQIAFVIRARTGYTNSLYQKVAAAPAGKMSTTCFVEGPYGVRHSLDSYGSVVLFAGGVGVTHQVPYVRDLVSGYAQGTVATRRVLLVWTIQSPEHLEWIRPWMTEILGMDKRRDVLRIMLFVSQPRSTKEIHSPSSTVQMFPGRPNITTLLSIEQEQQIGAMAVSVCGPGTLSDEVRMAVRDRQSRSSIDFVEEAFSW
jgi:predicted ferric reductase